jgi:steroid delta-isomerase-like uncharacterized protein
MSLKSNKELVERFYAEAINGRDLDSVELLLTKDFTHDGNQLGSAGQRDVVASFLNGFSDLHNEILMSVAEGDLVAAHQRWTGTHDGEFAGVPASGTEVEFTSTAILRIDGEEIAEAWDEVDMLKLMRQIQSG